MSRGGAVRDGPCGNNKKGPAYEEPGLDKHFEELIRKAMKN